MGLIQTWKSVMLDPVNFYKNLSKKDQYTEATKYFLKVQALLSGVGFIILFLFGLLLLNRDNSYGYLVILGLIIAYPLLLLFAWGMLYVDAGLLHLLVLIFGGKKKYVETFKVAAYSMSSNVLVIIPAIGEYVSLIYSLILQICGIKVRQQLSWGKSVAIVLIILGIIIIVSILLYPLINNFADYITMIQNKYT